MANLITLLRVLLAGVALTMLPVRSTAVYLVAALLTIGAISLDALDGWVARRQNHTTVLGAILDILGDRVIEMAYWIVFAWLGLVPAWIPVIIAARAVLVDGVRFLGAERGFAPFGDQSMVRSRIGSALVSSRWSRALYGAAKAIAFALVILAAAPFRDAVVFAEPALVMVYAAVAFCLLRALPVLIEVRALFAGRTA
jgi:CDP-diacylglycerol--glycerol-3-phosphate 3-phosphatidyltransferase